MRRTVFNEDHEAFRETLRDFIRAEVLPVMSSFGFAPALTVSWFQICRRS